VRQVKKDAKKRHSLKEIAACFGFNRVNVLPEFRRFHNCATKNKPTVTVVAIQKTVHWRFARNAIALLRRCSAKNGYPEVDLRETVSLPQRMVGTLYSLLIGGQ